jgi:hypothetical protein
VLSLPFPSGFLSFLPTSVSLSLLSAHTNSVLSLFLNLFGGHQSFRKFCAQFPRACCRSPTFPICLFLPESQNFPHCASLKGERGAGGGTGLTQSGILKGGEMIFSTLETD